MSTRATWKPHTTHVELDADHRNKLPDSVFAFPHQRKEPMTDAAHVRNAIARFDQVGEVTDSEREQAFANLKKAADHFGVEMGASSWRELGKPLTNGPSALKN
jgi:cell division protein FtsX